MLTDAEVRGRLSEMARAEGISAEEDALALMARYAFGSMRDGQSLFEQAAVSGGGSVTAGLVEGMLGLVGVEAAIDLVSAAVLDGAGAALTRFSSLLSRGADLKYLFLSLIDVLRDAAVLSFTGQEALLFRHSPASLDRMRELTARRPREEWMLFLDIASGPSGTCWRPNSAPRVRAAPAAPRERQGCSPSRRSTCPPKRREPRRRRQP